MNQNIALIGGVVVDEIVFLEDIRTEPFDWKVSFNHKLDLGGISSTLVTLLNLGIDTSLLGWIGKDYVSQIGISKLKEFGIDSSGVEDVNTHTTKVMAFIDSNGNHSRVVLPAKNTMTTLPKS